jgi:glycerate 2-kinase
MFGAVADLLPIDRGVVTAAGASASHGAVDLINSSHPAPNEASVRAGARALEVAREAEGTLLVLLSGGASAMMISPVDGVSLADKRETSRALMSAGAAIHELNCVRKHLSRVKGGQLGVAARRVVTLALSDVHGPVPDDPSVIGSGPTVADETTFADALDVIRARRVEVPAAAIAYLERGARGAEPETIKPGDPRLRDARYEVIGSRRTAVDGARQAAESQGFTTITVDEATTGEAREAGRAFVEEALRRSAGVRRPVCVIGSGETTVTVRGAGRGGRNQEFSLGAAFVLNRLEGQAVLGSAGTDGVDGPTDAAGAMVDPTTMTRAAAAGLSVDAALADNDAYPFFNALGDLVVWGPTGTNVGDVHVLLLT